jgi:2-dehydropantoate 2-reductase
VGASQPEPGIVKHIRSENTQMGLFSNHQGDEKLDQQRLTEFSSLLAEGKTKFEIVSNIQVPKWEKVVWNAAWNTLTALTQVDTHALLSSSPNAPPLSRQLMKEVIDVARKCEVPLEYELVDRLMDRIHSLQPINTSMQIDYKNERPMEVDVIIGFPVQKAKELGVATPILDTLYVVLTAINNRLIENTNR